MRVSVSSLPGECSHTFACRRMKSSALYTCHRGSLLYTHSRARTHTQHHGRLGRQAGRDAAGARHTAYRRSDILGPGPSSCVSVISCVSPRSSLLHVLSVRGACTPRTAFVVLCHTCKPPGRFRCPCASLAPSCLSGMLVGSRAIISVSSQRCVWRAYSPMRACY